MCYIHSLVLYEVLEVQLRIPLNTTDSQVQRLKELQAVFAQACNVLTLVVQKTRIWNRVALHHLAYKDLRTQFPAMGSQMACNAIYSVARTCRLLFQHPASPFNLSARVNKPLPLVRFDATCPVYFDRHTLSLRKGQISMVTLDGRMRFQLALQPVDEACFHQFKLREVVLSRTAPDAFVLLFSLLAPDDVAEPELPNSADIPQYLLIEEIPDATNQSV